MINCTFENGNKAKLRHVVVDSIAVKNNKILLVKRGPNHVSPGKYGVPGGFVELNETTKDAALRELKEETGYEGKITRLVAVIDDPNRKNEDRQNISFIYEIEVLDKTGEHDDEIKSVHWFDVKNLPPEEDFAFDHLEIIQTYLAKKFD